MWRTGEIIFEKGKKKVRYDLRTGHSKNLHHNESLSESSLDSEVSSASTSSSGDSSKSGTEEEPSIASMELFGVTLDASPSHGNCDDVIKNHEVNVKMLSSSLTIEEKKEYLNMLDEFPGLFANSYKELKGIEVVQHHIELKPGSKPVVQKLRRLGDLQQEALKNEISRLLAAGFIFPVDNSEWVSPVVVTPKKGKKWRICVDMRPLNKCTKRDHHPLPFQDEILNESSRA